MSLRSWNLEDWLRNLMVIGFSIVIASYFIGSDDLHAAGWFLVGLALLFWLAVMGLWLAASGLCMLRSGISFIAEVIRRRPKR